MKKLLKIYIIILLILFSIRIVAQKIPSSQYNIPWENGNITTLQDLDRVWIVLKSETIIKNARLWEIKPAEGKVVYEKEGTLHDLMIPTIMKILAGNNSRNILFFDDNNKPIIRMSEELFMYNNVSDFKVSKVPDPVVTTVSTDSTAKDTVVRSNGVVLQARILLISENEIKYKRADLPDGPVYIISNDSAVTVIKRAGSIKIIQKQQL